MDIIEEAVRVLRRDGLVVYPTETVYGLGPMHFQMTQFSGCTRQRTAARQPISIAVCDLDMLGRVAVIDPLQRNLLKSFFPGRLPSSEGKVLYSRELLREVPG